MRSARRLSSWYRAGPWPERQSRTKWRRQARELQARGVLQVSARPQFIALALPPAPTTAPMQSDIHMELRRGAATMSIRWPVAAAPECAAWLREWLR